MGYTWTDAGDKAYSAALKAGKGVDAAYAARDAVNSAPAASTPTKTTTPSSSSSSSSSSGSSGSSSGYSTTISQPAATQTTNSGNPLLASWMGNSYSQVPGTNYYSTNPSNPNSAKYYADGSPVASMGYDNTQAGGTTKFDGYGTAAQFQQAVQAGQSSDSNAIDNLYKSWIANGQLTSNDSIYNKPLTTPISNATTSANFSTRAPALYGTQTGTMVPLAGSKQYDVNDPEFLNMPADQRKQILLADPALMQKELERASKVWFDNDGKDPAKQAAAHAWAEELRQAAAAQQASSNMPTTTTTNPSTGTGSTPSVGAGGVPTGTPVSGVSGVINNNQALTDDLMKKFNDLLNNMNNTNGAAAQQLQATAAQQAQQAFDAKKTQYTDLINSLKSGQSTDLQNLTNDTSLATSNLEDKTFQNWLAARQGVANRGLASSGAASDADTRLLLSRQKDLGSLYNTQANAANNINKSYNDKLTAAQSTLAANNLGQTQADIFSKLFKDSQGSLGDQLKSVTDLLSKQFGYSQVNPADYLKASANLYGTDAKTKVAYDKMDQSDRQFYDKLAQENQKIGIQAMQWQADYGLKSSQIFGQDANGNPTLDAQKFVAEMAMKQQQADEQGRHNRASEGIGWAGVQNSRDSIAAKLQEISLSAAKFDKANEQFGLKFQGDTFKDIISTESKNLLDLRSSLDKSPNNDSIKKQYDSAVNRLNSAMAGLDNLAKTGLGSNYTGGSSTASTGTSETAGLSLSDDYLKNIRITLNNSGSSVTGSESGN